MTDGDLPQYVREPTDDDSRAFELLHIPGLTPDDPAWLDPYISEHDRPLDPDDVQVGYRRQKDLGVGMSGLELLGSRVLKEMGCGNVNVAGGWAFRVYSVDNPPGWECQLSGLEAFLEAFGAERIDAAHPMGPFSDPGGYQEAYYNLAVRLVAALSIAANRALASSPEARAVQARQQAEFEARPDRLAPPLVSWDGDIEKLAGHEPRLRADSALCDEVFASKQEAFLAGYELATKAS